MVLQLLLRREEDGVEARERVRRGAGLDSTAFVHCGRWTQPHATFHTKLLQGLRWDTHHQNKQHGCDVSALPPPETPHRPYNDESAHLDWYLGEVGELHLVVDP